MINEEVVNKREYKKDRKTILREEKLKERKKKKKEKLVKVGKAEKEESLREIIVKTNLKRINIQERIIVKALLDSRAMDLITSSKFTKRKRFRLKKIKKLISIRNIDRTLNKERLIVRGNLHSLKIHIYSMENRLDNQELSGKSMNVS